MCKVGLPKLIPRAVGLVELKYEMKGTKEDSHPGSYSLTTRPFMNPHQIQAKWPYLPVLVPCGLLVYAVHVGTTAIWVFRHMAIEDILLSINHGLHCYPLIRPGIMRCAKKGNKVSRKAL
jgi:hypothetical protein